MSLKPYPPICLQLSPPGGDFYTFNYLIKDTNERFLMLWDNSAGGGVSQSYIDGSLGIRDTSIENLQIQINQVNASLNSFSANSKITLGNILVGTGEYPITYANSIGSGRSVRFFDHLKNYFSEHTNFLWDISFEDGSIYKEKQFQNTGEFISFLNTVTPNNGTKITSRYSAECYVKINPEIGKISKVYGVNLFYSVLKGRKKYKERVPTLYDSLFVPNYWVGYKENFVRDIWDYFTYTGFITPANTEDAAKAIWFSQTPSNVYALLPIGLNITFNSIRPERYSYNSDVASFIHHDGSPIKIISSVIVAMDNYSKSYYIVGQNMKDRDYQNNTSYIRVYYLSAGDNLAILIKPIGQDTFRLNYIPDIASKDLYALYYEGTHNHQPIIRKLSTATKTNDIFGDISFLVQKTDWNLSPGIKNAVITKHIGTTTPKKFRFFIGDSHGNISSLGPVIEPYTFRTGAKIKTLIGEI